MLSARLCKVAFKIQKFKYNLLGLISFCSGNMGTFSKLFFIFVVTARFTCGFGKKILRAVLI